MNVSNGLVEPDLGAIPWLGVPPLALKALVRTVAAASLASLGLPC
jgi:hypothetical protein